MDHIHPIVEMTHSRDKLPEQILRHLLNLRHLIFKSAMHLKVLQNVIKNVLVPLIALCLEIPVGDLS